MRCIAAALVLLMVPLAGCGSLPEARPYASLTCPDGAQPAVRTAREARDIGAAAMGYAGYREDRFTFEVVEQDDHWVVYKRAVTEAPSGKLENTPFVARFGAESIKISKCRGVSLEGSFRP